MEDVASIGDSPVRPASRGLAYVFSFTPLWVSSVFNRNERLVAQLRWNSSLRRSSVPIDFRLTDHKTAKEGYVF